MGKPGYPTLSLAERDRRWALARAVMEKEGVEALIAYGEHECVDPAPYAPDAYFSNDRPGAIVIFVRDEDPISLVWSPMSVNDHATGWERGDSMWIAPENIRVGKSADNIVEVLRDHGVEKGAIGVLGLEPYPPWHIFDPAMSFVMWDRVRNLLPEAMFKPVQLSWYLATVSLSDEELACVRYSATVGDEMAQALLEAAVPGNTEGDLAAAVMAAAMRRGCHAPKSLMFTGPEFVAFGPPTWSYRPQAPRVLAEGDLIVAELFNKFGMYESQHQVSIVLGEPDADVRKAESIARAAYDAGLEAARPGNTFGDLVDAMTKQLEGTGGWRIHPLVHGMNPYGMVCGFGAEMADLWPPARGYGKLGVVPTVGGAVPLAPGMTFAFEPNCVVNGKVVNIGGTVIIGEDGAIELNPSTAKLLHT